MATCHDPEDAFPGTDVDFSTRASLVPGLQASHREQRCARVPMNSAELPPARLQHMLETIDGVLAIMPVSPLKRSSRALC